MERIGQALSIKWNNVCLCYAETEAFKNFLHLFLNLHEIDEIIYLLLKTQLPEYKLFFLITNHLTMGLSESSLYTALLTVCVCVCVCVCSVRIVAYQAPLSMEFSKQEYWSGLPFSSPRHLPDPAIEPASSALAGDFFTTPIPAKPFFSRCRQTTIALYSTQMFMSGFYTFHKNPVR